MSTLKVVKFPAHRFYDLKTDTFTGQIVVELDGKEYTIEAKKGFTEERALEEIKAMSHG